VMHFLISQVRMGGLIVIDNVLWHGKVADPQVRINVLSYGMNAIAISEIVIDVMLHLVQVTDPKTISIRNFNKKILEDKRVNISMVGFALRLLFLLFFPVESPVVCKPKQSIGNSQVPIGDGMKICRKISHS